MLATSRHHNVREESIGESELFMLLHLSCGEAIAEKRIKLLASVAITGDVRFLNSVITYGQAQFLLTSAILIDKRGSYQQVRSLLTSAFFFNFLGNS